MKTQTYNKIANVIAFIVGLFAIAIFGSAVLFFLFWLLLTGISNVFVFTFSIKYLTIVSSIVAIPIFSFVWVYTVATRLYGISDLRDFWVLFGHIVELDLDDVFKQRKEMIEWCDENCDHLYKMLGPGHTWIFWKETEAVAFKLRWT